MVRRTANRPLTVLALGVGLLMGTGLTGCGSGEVRSGTAAQIGDYTITVTTLQAETQHFVEDTGQETLKGQELGDAQNAVLGQLIANRLLVEAAAEQGVSASAADVDKSLRQLRSQINQASDENVRGFFQQYALSYNMLEEFVRSSVLGDKLITELRKSDPSAEPQQLVSATLASTSKRLGVEVNPRYGSWNGQQIDPLAGDLVEVEQPSSEPLAPQLPSQ